MLKRSATNWRMEWLWARWTKRDECDNEVAEKSLYYNKTHTHTHPAETPLKQVPGSHERHWWRRALLYRAHLVCWMKLILEWKKWSLFFLLLKIITHWPMILVFHNRVAAVDETWYWSRHATVRRAALNYSRGPVDQKVARENNNNAGIPPPPL